MRRARTSLLGMIALVCACASTLQGADPEITVAVQGLQVMKPAPGGDNMLQALANYPGTTVALLVTDPGGRLVAFDEEASSVTSFTDDKGKDLTKAEGKSKFANEVLRDWAFRPTAGVTKEGKYCCLDVTMPGLPGKQATAIALSGKLVFLTARQEKEFTAENVSLRAGTKVNTGLIPLTIKQAGKPQFGGDAPMEVEFRSDQKLDAITRIRFFDAAGKEIPSREHVRSSGTFSDAPASSNFEATIAYRLQKPADAARLVITGWTDAKQVTVPFDLKVGLGL